MKKILSVLAIAAMVAVGLASCEGQASKDFKITVSNVTETTADLRIEPADTTISYYYSYYPTQSIAKMTDDSLSIVIAAELELIRQYVVAMGMEITMEEMLEILLTQGVAEIDLMYLEPGTDYTVIAAKMDYQGVINGTIAKKNFTTLEAVMGQLTFTFENNGSSIVVTPSNDYEAWDYALFTAEEYAQYNGDKNVAAADNYAYYGVEYAEPGVLEFPLATIAEYIGTGDMVLLAYACDETGITSEVAEFQFNVPASAAAAPAKINKKEALKSFKAMKNVEKKCNVLKAMKR